MSTPNMPQIRSRADLSHFLVHLTKNGAYEEFRVFRDDPLDMNWSTVLSRPRGLLKRSLEI